MKTRLTVIGGIAAFICLMVLTSQGTLRANAEGEHQHCVCGGYYGASSTACPYKDMDNGASGKIHADGIVWTEWTSTNTLPKETGYYYLSANVKLTAQFAPENGNTVYLCLNGHNIEQTKTGTSGAFRILTYSSRSNTKYVFTDCASVPGKVFRSGAGTNGQGAMIWLTGADTNSNNTFEAFRITLDTTNFAATYGPILVTKASNNQLNLYGVTVEGGSASGTDSAGKSGYGGTLKIEAGQVRLRGTTVKAGTAVLDGNCIYFSGGTLYVHDKCVIDEVCLTGAKFITVADEWSADTYVGVKHVNGTGTATNLTTAAKINKANWYLHPTDDAYYLSYGTSDSNSVLSLAALSDVTDPHFTSGHCVCGNTEAVTATTSATPENDHAAHNYSQKWIPWDNPNIIPRGFENETSHYYLTGNVTASMQSTIPENAKVSLCLNGHSISFTHNGRLLSTNDSDSSEFVFTNCGALNEDTGAGWIQSTNTGKYDAQGGVVWMNGSADASVRLYHVGLNGGTHQVGRYGGLLAVSNGHLYAYDAAFKNGIAYKGAGAGTGGAISTLNSGTAALYSSVVFGCSAETNGGSIYAVGPSFILKDSSVTGGTAKLGGNVFTGTDTAFSIVNSTISDGVTTELTDAYTCCGGNVYSQGTTVFTSGTVSGGQSGRGGNVDVAGGIFSLLDGTISGGYAPSGANVRVESSAEMIMENGSILNPAGYASEGGAELLPSNNVFLNLNAKLAMSGGTIASNASAPAVHGVEVNGSRSDHDTANALFILEDGTVRSGSDSTNAIRNHGDLIVNGGFVDGTIYSADSQESPIHPATISLSGGYYSERPEEEYVAEGCRVFDDTSVEGYYFTIAGGYQVETASGALTGEIYAVAPITGGGAVRAGKTFTLTAPQVSGYQFVGWYENGALIPGATALTYTDTATEDRTLVATYRYGETEGFRVIVEGTEDFTVNGTAAAGQFPSGTEVTVAYTGTGEFRGWTNAGGKLLSRDQEYVFTLSSDITLKALASGAETPLAVFYNVSYQMMTLITAGAGLDASKIPTLTALRGRNLLGWKANGTLYADNAALAEYLGAKTGSGITEVYASYEESTDDSAKYQVTVSYRELGESGVPADWTRLKDDTVLEAVNVTNTVEISADETLGGKSFLGFVDADGQKLSLSATTMVRFDADTTVYAVYGSITVEPEPSVRFVTASKDGNTVYFEALRNVPEGYTLKEQGILFTTDALKGEVPAEDALLYNSNDVVKFTSNGKLANDVTGLTLKNMTVTVYARAYVVYEKDGVEGIIYSEVSSK